MKKIAHLAIALILLTILSACSGKQNETGKTKIAILHTNDMHGEINNMARLAAFKKEAEKKYDHVFLVSAGDLFSGNPVVDVYKEKGYPMIDLMNRVGYDISAIGNHEFDYGQKVLAKRMKQANFQFICANINTRKTDLPQPQPYAVLKASGKKLFFLSLIETWNEGLPSTHPQKLKGIEFQDPAEVPQKFIHMADNYDAFMGLTHLGFKADKHLVENYPRFDLIIGGHSHTLTDSVVKVNNTIIAQAGDDVNFVGKVVLTFNQNELTDIKSEIINLYDFNREDPKIAALIKEYNNNEALTEVIGEAASAIKGKQELGALFTDAQTNQHRLDFAFQNNGGIRISEIPKGPIQVKKIYELDPFGNELIKFEMTPSEMKSLLRYSYQKRKEPSLQISGGSYTLYVNQENELDSIQIRNTQDQRLHPDSTYSVGLNSYISSSYKFDHKDQGKSLYVTTATNLINYIKEIGTVDYEGEQRVFLKEQ